MALGGRSAGAVALATALILTGPIHSEHPVEIDIRPAFTTAPGSLSVIVHVTPHDDNRQLVVEADSSDFYRASYIPLDGAQTARTYPIMLKGLPAGRYTITSRLRGRGGDRAVESVVVDVLER